ncbi:GrpB family protein [Nesterenkonia ebinurensis]|uniref:GrpB family protein n=1 Tax=Nesterenkonia ebinurensis TaxID=2608252 RepID=UPI00123CC624|nr:GrpB family protein [Nesterenkonia ebinurensis]
MPTAHEIVEHKPAEPPHGQSPFLPGKEPRPGVEVVRYDSRWPEAYQVLQQRVRASLGRRVLALDHVGSTAVPGLAAKPVIDLTLIVADPAEEDAWVPDLEAAGFDLVIREPWWYEHRALVHTEPRSNLHVYGPDAAEPVRQRMFRDWLIEHPDDRALYEQAKLSSAEAANDAGEHVMQYNARKERVIRDIYDRAFRAAGLL